MDNDLISIAMAAVGGLFSKSAFDYYWKRFKLRSDAAASGGEVKAKDEIIQLLTIQQKSLLKDLEELRAEYVDLKMEVATLRAENKAMATKLTELQTINEILKRK